MELIFAGRPVISGRLANRNGSRIGANKKKLRGVIAPISTPNDYLDTVVDDVVSPSWSQKNASHGPLGKASTRWNTLPACEKSFRTRLQERPECYL